MKNKQNIIITSDKGALGKLLHPISSEILAAIQEDELNIHQLSTRLYIPKSSVRRYLLELKAENLVKITRTEKKRGLEVKYYMAKAKLYFPRLNQISSVKTSMIGLESLFREIRYFFAGYLLGQNLSIEEINKTLPAGSASEVSLVEKIEHVRKKRQKDTVEEKEIEDREFAIKQLRKRYPLIWSVLREVERIIEFEEQTLQDPKLSSEQIRLLLINKATQRVLGKLHEEFV